MKSEDDTTLSAKGLFQKKKMFWVHIVLIDIDFFFHLFEVAFFRVIKFPKVNRILVST